MGNTYLPQSIFSGKDEDIVEVAPNQVPQEFIVVDAFPALFYFILSNGANYYYYYYYYYNNNNYYYYYCMKENQQHHHHQQQHLIDWSEKVRLKLAEN